MPRQKMRTCYPCSDSQSAARATEFLVRSTGQWPMPSVTQLLLRSTDSRSGGCQDNQLIDDIVTRDLYLFVDIATDGNRQHGSVLCNSSWNRYT